MRKDYVAVDTATSGLDEATFVEQFWTDQWRDRTKPPDVSAVAAREEYRLIQPYLNRLTRGSRILDGGCGTGEWTVFLTQQGFDVTGIDISRATIARLANWFPQYQFHHSDLRHTDYPDGWFDAYISWGTFEHFESGLGECLIEARPVLRPGGWLFISVPFHNLRLLLRDARGQRWDEDGGLPRRFCQWRLTRSELRCEMAVHGFRVHRITPIGQLTGAGRMLQWDLPLFAKRSRSYSAARRVLATVAPAGFLSHMILAAAERT